MHDRAHRALDRPATSPRFTPGERSIAAVGFTDRAAAWVEDMRIAVIEDDAAPTGGIASSLSRAGWSCRAFPDGRSFLAAAHRESYDAYVVDCGLPDMPGLDVLRALRSSVPAPAPILFLAAPEGEQDAIAAGADDFVVKPARLSELQTRLRALGRRHLPPAAPTVFAYDRFRFDLRRQHAFVDGAPSMLTHKEFLLALLLMRNLGRPLSRGHIREAVWGRDPEIQSRTMDTHVSRVRRKLSLSPEHGYRLAPVYGYGYRLEQLSRSGTDGPPAPRGAG
jgi:DNA-binding response OmpR family regulator